MSRAPLAVVLSVAWLPARAAAQSPAPPVFGTEADVVAVDVNVVDGEGRPMRGLSAADFTLTVDGQRRQVTSAEFLAFGEADEPPPAPPAVTDFSSNETVRRGRVVVVVVDQAGIGAGSGRLVLNSVERLLGRLGPEDQVGLVTMPGGGPQVAFTTDHSVVRNALQKVVGLARFRGQRVSLAEAVRYDLGGSYDWEQVVTRECPFPAGPARDQCEDDLESEAISTAQNFRHNSQVSMKGLRLLMDSLREMDTAKTVVLMTQALSAESKSELRELAVAAASARVALYGILIEDGAPDAGRALPDLGGFEDSDLLTRDLYRLASLTRGHVFRSVGSGAPLEHIAREISGYYLLGFEPEGNDRDGKDHTIEVAVRRPGATVRARRSLPFAREKREEARDVVARTIRSPHLAAELPLRVTTYTFPDRGEGGKVRVLVSAEIGRSFDPAGLTVGFAFIDSQGRLAAQGVQVIKPEAAAAASAVVPYLGTASVEPGLYTLKLAAADARGRRGSVQHPVKAALTTAGPLSMTDLILAPPAREQGATLRPGVEAVADGPALTAFLEVHAPEDQLAQITVAIEVAPGESGAALRSVDAQVAPARAQGARTVQAVIPVDGLAPGRYVARAVVSAAGRPLGQVTRQFLVPPRGAALALPWSPMGFSSVPPEHGTPVPAARLLVRGVPAAGRVAWTGGLANTSAASSGRPCSSSGC
ncbi:MAG TPA: VWA domain-containing protein [Vicinamibacteria bacterium]